MTSLKYNASGYKDPTAQEALEPIANSEAAIEKKAHNLVNTIKFITEWAGFEIVGRIHLRDKELGKDFK